jgi:putative lipase involved disintegration of autophagic bodies
MSAQVVLTGMPSLADAQHRGEALKAMLGAGFGIPHVTFELECVDPTGRADPTP